MFMKTISIKTQKILLFVPIVNCFLLFALYYNHFRCARLTMDKVVLAILLGGIAVVPIGIVLANKLIPFEFINTFLSMYIMPMVMGLVFIKIQKWCGVE